MDLLASRFNNEAEQGCLQDEGSAGNMDGHPSNTVESVLSFRYHLSRPASFMQDPGGENTGSFSCTSLASIINNLVVDGPWALLKDLS